MKTDAVIPLVIRKPFDLCCSIEEEEHEPKDISPTESHGFQNSQSTFKVVPTLSLNLGSNTLLSN